MSDNPAEPTKDSLGLDLESLKINDDPSSHPPEAAEHTDKKDAAQPPEQPPADHAQSPSTKDADATPNESPSQDQLDDKKAAAHPREKKKPYVNLERVKTGGAQRDKLTEEELAERMARIREQNEKIKQRRLDVEEDEREFKKKQDADRAKIAKTRKVQETIDRTREQNARRKLDKIQSREWDSGKPGVKKTGGDDGNGPSNPAHTVPTGNIGIRGGFRGGVPGRGRGRGGHNAGPPPPPASSEKPPAEPSADTAAPEVSS